MPNRIIKESICTSENIDNLTLEEERFFYRLLVNCDDFGRMDARTQILRAKCFPLKVDSIKPESIEKWLMALAREELVTLYEFEGKRYLQFNTWDKHQQVRATKSKYPAPDDDGVNLISFDINGNQEISNVPVIDIRNRNRNTLIEAQLAQKPKPKSEKVQYAEFVHMKESDYQKLIDRFGEAAVIRMIETLDNYKGANGKKYKDDYRAILNWVVERVSKEAPQLIPASPNKDPAEKYIEAFDEFADKGG